MSTADSLNQHERFRSGLPKGNHFDAEEGQECLKVPVLKILKKG
jgi:hypothetical protein